MGVTFTKRATVDFTSLLFGDKAMMQLVGEAIVKNIKGKSLDGKNVFGRKHKPYSNKPLKMSTTGVDSRSIYPYTPAKSSVGEKKQPFKVYKKGYRQYKKEVFGSDTVNLRNTGKMMLSLRIKSSRQKVKIFLSNKDAVAAGIKNQSELRRKWFGVGDRRKTIPKLISSKARFTQRKSR